MNDYVVEVKTAKDLGQESFVRSLLEAWYRDTPSPLRPQFFDLGEPIKRSLQAEGVETAVRLWVDQQLPLMLQRRSPPSFEADIYWRPVRGVDDRPFPWGCTVWLNRSAGDNLARTLLDHLINFFEPAFGFITTEDDSREKHKIVFADTLGQAEEYVGLDVGRTIPGVYWTTYFGPDLIERLGKDTFNDLRAYNVEPRKGGYLVQAYPSIADAGTPTARETEDQLIGQLGQTHFFDKSLVDIESRKMDPATSNLIEKKIQQAKSQRKKEGE